MATFLVCNFQGLNQIPYQINISNEAYTGDFFNIAGSCSIKRPRPKSLMETIRGSELDIRFIVDENTTPLIKEIANEGGDKVYKVVLLENGNTIWEGFLKPDGIQESYVFDRYELKLSAIDGLGYLETTTYLDVNGNAYFGNENEMTILSRCLKLTGIDVDSWLYDFNLYYSVDENANPTLAQPALSTTSVNQDRFKNDDNKETTFTCKKVVDGILKKYGAMMFYYRNEFHILKIRTYYNNNILINRRKYESDGTFIIQESYDKLTNLGSQVKGFNPHHAGANQLINYKGSLGAYKMYYEYGFVASIIDNDNIIFNSSSPVDIDNWTVLNSNFTQFVTDEEGIRALYLAESGWPVLLSFVQLWPQMTQMIGSITSAQQDVVAGESLILEVTGEVSFRRGRIGAWIFVILDTSSDTWFLSEEGWTTSVDVIKLLEISNTNRRGLVGNFNSEINIPGVPDDGRIRVILNRPFEQAVSFIVTLPQLRYIKYTSVTINGSTNTGIKGISFTGTRVDKPTAIVELEDKIYVGDNDSDIYIGAIEDSANENTVIWSRSANGVIVAPYYPLLELTVRDRLEIQLGNQIEFTGDVYGYLPYLGMLRIDNFDETFMMGQWNWDIMNNKISISATQIFFNPVDTDDIDIDSALEGDNVIRPQIVG